VTTCAFCGRDNQGEARFCIDCGKALSGSSPRVMAAVGGAARPSAAPVPPVNATAGRSIACPYCQALVDPALPFCAHCGGRVAGGPPRASGTAVLAASARENGPKLALLTPTGEVEKTFTLPGGEGIVGRNDGDIQLPDDVYLSPVHAQFAQRDGALWVRDLGSRNGTWVFIDGPHRLTDGDVILIGSQLLRFRRLGYPGPHPPEADKTRRLGSATPTADIAVLAQLRADSSVRDTFHLSPGRSITIGRDRGDWIFPYDPTMSGLHAEIRSEDSDFIVVDAQSRNGIAVAVRGERPCALGQRVLLGDRILRVEQL
jgi:pSer/pThr/pTyr-binding forkhead associated (FHA) protein